MNDSNSTNVARDRLEHLISTFSNFRMLIIVPTVVCTFLAIGYSVLKSNTWTASQSLSIRDDLTGQSFKPGRFESLESLKLAQETILEVARKPQVIRNALKKLGPPSSMMIGKSDWPSEKMIERTQGRITIAAPNGAEFGKTEIILLNTKESTRERAREFIELMLHEIDQKLSEVRTLKVNSMVKELEQAVESAKASFEHSAKELQEMDAGFGADLSTMRGFNDQQSGDGSLQQTIAEIRKEQRVAAEKVDSALKQRELLIKAIEEPKQFLVTSSELLTMQPRLNQLVVGLSKAELELAEKRGKFTEIHVDVISAKEIIRDIKLQILKEIYASIHGLSSQIEVAQSRADKLKHYETEYEKRLSGLSSSRVAYDKLEQEVQKKSEVLGQARQDLAQIQALGASAVNLLTPVGEPQVATRPDGPGKRVIVGAGAIGGFLLGLGLVMFVAPPFENRDQESHFQVSSQSPQFSSEVPTEEPEVQSPHSPQVTAPIASSKGAEDSIIRAAVPMVKTTVDTVTDKIKSMMANFKDSVDNQANQVPTSVVENSEENETLISNEFSQISIGETALENQTYTSNEPRTPPLDSTEQDDVESSETGDKQTGSEPEFDVHETVSAAWPTEVVEKTDPGVFDVEAIADNAPFAPVDEPYDANPEVDQPLETGSETDGPHESVWEVEELHDIDSEIETGSRIETVTTSNLDMPTISIDPNDAQSRRKDNLRPIDLTRPDEGTDATIAAEQQPPMPRLPDTTIPVDEIIVESSESLARFETHSPQTGSANEQPQAEKNSAEEVSVDEIVQRIRAQQIAAAKASSSKIPQISEAQTAPDQTQATPPINPFSQRPSQDEESERTKNLQEVVKRAEASLDVETPQDDSEESSKALPIPDQIKQLSQKISTFCAPMKNNDSDKTKEDPDF